MSYDYSENILVQESAGNLLKDELRWDVKFAYNTEILGKDGRIVLIEEEIRILCGEIDVFKGDVNTCEYFRLMSGDGITVSGINSIDGEQMDIIVYYTYHRK